MRYVKTFIIFTIFLLRGQETRADLPAKKIKREPVNVQFIQVQALGKFRLYIKDEDSLYRISADTTYIISASQGAPHCIYFFAQSGTYTTDTISICEYDQQNTQIRFNGLQGRKLDYTETAIPIVSTSYSSENESKTPTTPASFFTRNKTIFYITIPVLALAAMLGIFFYYKKRKNKISKS